MKCFGKQSAILTEKIVRNYEAKLGNTNKEGNDTALIHDDKGYQTTLFSIFLSSPLLFHIHRLALKF